VYRYTAIIVARFDFLVESYRTEREKTLGVWSQVPDAEMGFRPDPRARSPLEHMVHQCLSEEAWMANMLGITVSRPALPATETRLEFLRRGRERGLGAGEEVPGRADGERPARRHAGRSISA